MVDDATSAWIWQRLKQSLQALAMPAEIQPSLFPDFVCKADELALDFDHWRSCVVTNDAGVLTEPQSRALTALDTQLELMGGEANSILWTEEALYIRPGWMLVRSLAVDALAAFGWDVVAPAPTENVYVPGGQVDEP
jgi:hypothetical protein